MKRWICLVAVLMLVASMALGASKEEFITAIPKGDPTKDSTYAQVASSAADWISLEAAEYRFSRLEVAVYWTKTADIDTLELKFRVAGDPTAPICVDSLAMTASGAYQKVYTLDSLDLAAMQYWQVVARFGVIDNANALRTQPIIVYWRWLPPGETKAVWRRHAISMVVTE